MRTMIYKNRPRIRATSGIAGRKEGEGPLGACFDAILPDDLLGQDTWEQAESVLLQRTILCCLEKGGRTPQALGALFCGDLENQLCASAFTARALGVPFFGLYGACSTVIEALVLGAALIDGGFLPSCVCAASSHFCTAERQFRFPLELGNQRPPSAQWTATAAGAFLLDPKAGALCVESGTIGRVVEYPIKDANHMGAAMAPAVSDTLTEHLRDTGRSLYEYDLFVTGDLGQYGRALLLELLRERGFHMPEAKLVDCGASLFSPEQDAHAGGSGCGCIASVLARHFVPMIEDGRLSRVLALGSGAMLSPTSAQQGESIPGISYAVALEALQA